MNCTDRRDTDKARQDSGCRRRFSDHCEEHGDHVLFLQTNTKARHFKVKLYGEEGNHVMSVRRIAYALTHPNEHVSEDEDVIVTCEHKGESSTGHGCCVKHLVKVPRFQSRARVEYAEGVCGQ